MRYGDRIQDQTLREAYAKHASDAKLTDLQDDVAILRAFCEVMVSRIDLTKVDEWPADKIGAVTNLIQNIEKVTRSINDNAIKQKYLVHTNVVTSVIDQVVEIMRRKIDDPELMRAIAAELGQISVEEPPASTN